MIRAARVGLFSISEDLFFLRVSRIAKAAPDDLILNKNGAPLARRLLVVVSWRRLQISRV